MELLLEIRSLGKSFRSNNVRKSIFSNIDFNLYDQEIVALIGPSGCGKSTLLNVIAGIDLDFDGKILLEGENTSLTEHSKVSYMQQKDLLLPWRNVLENAILGLEINKYDNIESKQKALNLLPDFGLEGTEDLFPRQLSGGMRQRVSFLRSILLERPIMLLDEPFSSLDSITRHKMQKWVSSILIRNKKSVVLVTHDISEAVLLSDRVLIMGGSPSRICLEYKINLSRPRNLSFKDREDFNQCEKDINEELLKYVPRNL